MAFRLGSLTVDPVANVVSSSGGALPLGTKVVATLVALCERAGEVVPKAALFERVWGDAAVDDSSLWQNVHVLRGVLAQHVPGARIETLKGRGYRLVEAALVEIAPVAVPPPRANPKRGERWLLPAAMFLAGAVTFAGYARASAPPNPARIVLVRLQSGTALPALPPLPPLAGDAGDVR